MAGKAAKKPDKPVRPKQKTIVVAGDCVIDWLEYPVRENEQGEHNWQLFNGLRYVAKPGGAYQLAEFVRRAVGDTCKVIAQQPPANAHNVAPEEMLHSVASLARFVEGEKKHDCYRIVSARGFVGPLASGGGPSGNPPPPPLLNDSRDYTKYDGKNCQNYYNDPRCRFHT